MSLDISPECAVIAKFYKNTKSLLTHIVHTCTLSQRFGYAICSHQLVL